MPYLEYEKSIKCVKKYCGIPKLIKSTTQCDIYEGIESESNEWIELACEEAILSVKLGGGPFGAVLVQIDDETGDVIRYWKTHNTVTLCSDPTAHAEVNVIRAACNELKVYDLSQIMKDESALKQNCETSHCDIYSSTEPCPMCYSAISWARIPATIFAATRFDAAAPGVEFSDKELYDDFKIHYSKRRMIIRHASLPSSIKPFDLWKNTETKKY